MKHVLTAAAIVSAAFVAFYGWRVFDERREAQKAAAAELAAADRSRALELRAELNLQRGAANEAGAARRDASVDEAVARLTSPAQPMNQCDGALTLGRLGAREQIPLLIDVLNNASSSSLQNCAAAALVMLGETGPAMAAYTRWAESTDPTLNRAALVGFGDIGPSAAGVALPYLTEAVKSPQMDVRYIAVLSLAKLGPAAIPLLQVAAGDADRNVRDQAARALKGNR